MSEWNETQRTEYDEINLNFYNYRALTTDYDLVFSEIKENFENSSSNSMKIGLITRCYNEKYVYEFVRHYKYEGVNDIYIIDDNSDNSIYSSTKDDPCVHIIKDVPFQNGPELDIVYHRIKKKYDWIICVDLDEYITTVSDKNSTIRKELETTYSEVDCIKIPWVMMSYNNLEKDPNILLENNIYRWNHDLKHDTVKDNKKFRCRYNEIEVKSIFKPKKFDKLTFHIPDHPNEKKIIVVNSINSRKEELNPFYSNLRETDIRSATLVCYHFRITSNEHIYRKIKNNKVKSYTDLIYKTNETLIILKFKDCAYHNER